MPFYALLQFCSFIAICKVFCKEIDGKIDSDSCGIQEYIRILPTHYPTFAKEAVSFIGMGYRSMQPWKSIDRGYSPNWWVAYNKVKHHRDKSENGKINYKLANQKNVADSLAALYVLVEYWAAFHFANSPKETQNNEMPTFYSNRVNMKKWCFYESFLGQPPWFNTKQFLLYLHAEEEVF